MAKKKQLEFVLVPSGKVDDSAFTENEARIYKNVLKLFINNMLECTKSDVN